MDTEKRYRQYSAYLKEIFGCKVYKVTLDAGFSCPNRDGKISTGGCIFCEDGGSFSQAHSSSIPIKEQLETSIFRLQNRFKAKKFISYFQAFSNTYAPVKKLEMLYNQAIDNPDVVGISIGTRPDCVDKDKISLINSYAQTREVWLEYGIQSIHNKTLELINRGHTAEDFFAAYDLTRKYGDKIKICTHVILGLPGENRHDMLETAKSLANIGIDGIKVHLLCALKNTELENIYNRGEFDPLSEEEYVDSVCDYLEIMPKNVVIHRLAGNGLKKILVAPKWLPEKFRILNLIDREMERRGSFQGDKFL